MAIPEREVWSKMNYHWFAYGLGILTGLALALLILLIVERLIR